MKRVFGKELLHILSGNWAGAMLDKNRIGYFLFVILLVIVLIFNRYRTEELIGKKRDLQEKLDELHAESTHIRSDLMSWGTESKILADSFIINFGMKLPEKPPKIIKQTQNE